MLQKPHTEGEHKWFNTFPPWENPSVHDSLTDRLLLRVTLRTAEVTQPKRSHCCVQQSVAVTSDMGRKGFPDGSRQRHCGLVLHVLLETKNERGSCWH